MMPTQGDANFKLRQTQLESLTVTTNNELQNAPLNSVILSLRLSARRFQMRWRQFFKIRPVFAHAVSLKRSP